MAQIPDRTLRLRMYSCFDIQVAHRNVSLQMAQTEHDENVTVIFTC